jgi:ubiquinol-cytochrome c reductase cytochrome b subunit
MSEHSTYQPGTGVEKWLDERLPVVRFAKEHLMDFPTPKNLNYFWTFGAILAIMLVVQIVTGIILAMHYTPNIAMAFNSVEHIRRDVNGGRIIQATHAVGASMFFAALYIHMGRNLYFGSYKAPREILYIIGVLIFILVMATAFMGYVLPWGQMSFWAATVITNIFAAIPVVGNPILELLRGGFAVDNPTLNRFFSLHYLLPFVVAALVALHIWALHVPGNNNPTGVDVKSSRDTVPFHPYYTMKDLFAIVVFAIPFAWFDLHSRYPWPPRQLCHGQQPGHSGPYRARMVLPALLCDPARHRLQHPVHRLASGWCDLLCRLHRDPAVRAVARSVASSLGHLPPAVQVVLLAVHHQLPGSGLSGRGAG